MSTPSPVRTPLASAEEYVPRRPHETVLYGIVREHLATFLVHTRQTYKAPLPKYVVDTFEHYLACGDVARGFLRCHCGSCGHDVLVAFSCKARGLCPSCGARRMCNEAANLVDRIFPQRAREAVGRVAAMGVAWASGDEAGRARRDGSDLRRGDCPHDQTARRRCRRCDGVGRVPTNFRRQRQRSPTYSHVGDRRCLREDLCRRGALPRGACSVEGRRWRGREARARPRGEVAAPPSLHQRAHGRGAQPRAPRALRARSVHPARRRFSATYDGFDVYCAVRLAADDDAGRERLARYCARPPFALDRIEVLRDGRIA